MASLYTRHTERRLLAIEAMPKLAKFEKTSIPARSTKVRAGKPKLKRNQGQNFVAVRPRDVEQFLIFNSLD